MLSDMTVWFSSDLHFGHANIIKYCERPFNDVGHMNQALISGWNEVVQPGDTVWVLGDVSLGSIEDSLALVGRLNGSKLLVAGNHDRCWPSHGPKAMRWIDRYLEAGFAEIMPNEVSLTVGTIEVRMCHFPYRGDSHDADRYVDERPADHGGWLLHGHVHERWRQRDRMINVGTDAWNFRPVSDHEIAKLIEAGPQSLAPLPTT
jgi:calcineurin-like phosphoesterase family protein